MITKNGPPAAKIVPEPVDRMDDAERRAAHKNLVKSLKATRITGYRVGKITEDDKYGDG